MTMSYLYVGALEHGDMQKGGFQWMVLGEYITTVLVKI